MDPLRDDDSLLSTLSPQSSGETDVAHFGRLELTWTDGDTTFDGIVNGERQELGQEVSVVDSNEEGTKDVPVGPKRDLPRSLTPPSSLKISTRRYDRMYSDATPKAGVGACDPTPKAGTASRNPRAKQGAGKKHSTSTAGGIDLDNPDDLATPSWDIDRAFSFTKKVPTEPKEPQRSPTSLNQSFSGIWDFVNAAISRSMTMTGNEESDSESTNEPLGSPSATEAKENDMFAMEVGLIFSMDEGDTINDPSTLYSQNHSSSFTIESETSVDHPAAYDIDEYNLKHSTSALDTTYATTKGDDSTIHTAGQSTVRDDHGNKVPENAKMILGYNNVKKRRSPRRQRDDASIFPTVQKADTAPEEMERRLRELAGQINTDWRDSAFMPPALARRLRDFQFAREKRRKKYGKAKPWGIIGLYDHLSGVKIDVAWAEDAAWRRQNKQPYLTWGDFEKAKNEVLHRPIFTYILISVCTAMMVASIALNDWKLEPLSVNPMLGPSAETLLKLGAKDSYLIVAQQEVWRLASPMVLHAGLIHFFLNMFALWFVGKAVEQIHGFFPAVIQFVVPAIGGTILSAIFLPEYITVGASGGIFGLIGACVSDIIMNWNLLFNQFVNERGARLSHARVLVVLFLDIVVNCLIGLTPFVDNFTHLGGMIYGFLCGLSTIQLVSPRFFGDDRQCFHRCKLFFFRSFGLLVCVAGIIASSIVLFSGDGDTSPYPTMSKLSCIAFPPWKESNEKWWYCDTCSRASAEGTLDTETGKFIALNLKCPNGPIETVDVDEAWPQDEVGLEGILEDLCREHCL